MNERDMNILKELVETYGVNKRAIYTELGISRPTLDAWIRSGKLDGLHEKAIMDKWGKLFK